MVGSAERGGERLAEVIKGRANIRLASVISLAKMQTRRNPIVEKPDTQLT